MSSDFCPTLHCHKIAELLYCLLEIWKAAVLCQSLNHQTPQAQRPTFILSDHVNSAMSGGRASFRGKACTVNRLYFSTASCCKYHSHSWYFCCSCCFFASLPGVHAPCEVQNCNHFWALAALAVVLEWSWSGGSSLVGRRLCRQYVLACW